MLILVFSSKCHLSSSIHGYKRSPDVDKQNFICSEFFGKQFFTLDWKGKYEANAWEKILELVGKICINATFHVTIRATVQLSQVKHLFKINDILLNGWKIQFLCVNIQSVAPVFYFQMFTSLFWDSRTKIKSELCLNEHWEKENVSLIPLLVILASRYEHHIPFLYSVCWICRTYLSPVCIPRK